MRTALTLLTLAALACTADRPEADTAMTPPLEAAPDSADEWFVSEHGFRIPLEDQAEFLACAKEWEDWEWGWVAVGPGDWPPDVGTAIWIGAKCVPDEAIPAEGLGFCEQPGTWAPCTPTTTPTTPSGQLPGAPAQLRIRTGCPYIQVKSRFSSRALHYCPGADTPFFTVMPSSPVPATEGEA